MMAKKCCISICIIIYILSLSATSVPAGFALAGSYLERATGIDALHLNPAKINEKVTTAEYSFFSFAGGLSVNFFHAGILLGPEGRMMGDREKNEILDDIYLSAIAKGNAQLLIAGFSVDKYAISTSMNAFGYSRLDKKYATLILQGNEYGTHYNFSNNTGMSGMLYQDMTVGYGGEVINGWFGEYMADLPDVYVGISASYLIGAKMAETDKVKSELLTTVLMNSTLEMTQSAVVRESERGKGFKMNIGFSSQVYTWDDEQYVTAGTSFDNLFGFIDWKKNKYYSKVYDIHLKNHEYTFEMDNADDYLTESDFEEWTTNGIHTTHFPVTHRMAGKYVYKTLSASLDIEQNLTRHNAFSHTPEISLGFQNVFGKKWPVQLGYRVPFREFLAAYAFGAAYCSPFYEIGFALSVENSFNYKNMKGASFAIYNKYRFNW